MSEYIWMTIRELFNQFYTKSDPRRMMFLRIAKNSKEFQISQVDPDEKSLVTAEVTIEGSIIARKPSPVLFGPDDKIYLIC